MSIITRSALGYLAVTGLFTGIWAYAFPAGFYLAFPGFGRAWIAMDGPYNQHLIRDVGAAYLMIAALAVLMLLRPRIAAPVVVGLPTLVFNLAHLAYHMVHLGMYAPIDQLLNATALLLAVAASAWLTFQAGLQE